MSPNLPVPRQRSCRQDVSITVLYSVCSLDMLDKKEKRELLSKFLKQFKKSPCLWDTENIYYHNKAVKEDALAVLLKMWNKYEPITLEGIKMKIQGLRSMYRRERNKVESSAAASINYTPTLWYYKHLSFLSGKKENESEDSDSDHNEDTIYVQLPRDQKSSEAKATSEDKEGNPESSIDASAAAFGKSVGAQLQHLSKVQRCIAEKLISDVIYYGKMEQLSLETSINVKDPAGDKVVTVIPQAGPSWYDTDLDNGGAESSSNCQSYTETSEDLVRREMEETQLAVNCIKMESDDGENYIFHDDEGR